MAKLADGSKQRKRFQEMTNDTAGKMLLTILTKWTAQTCRMDARIKRIVDAAPGTSGQIIAILPSNLQAEALMVIALIDTTCQAHKPTE